MTTNTELVAKGLSRGKLLHLVQTGAAETLCGHRHGVNPRYIKAGSLGVHPADQADCPRCIKLAGER